MTMMINAKKFIAPLLFFQLALAVSAAFGQAGRELDENGRLYRATPESQGISSDVLADLVRTLDRDVNAMNSLMILRHGKVIAEAWWSPYTPETTHAMYSLSKSFTSTAVGLAVAEKRLDIDAPVVDFFPDELPNELSDNLKKMKIRHLLSMSCGHENEAAVKLFDASRDQEDARRSGEEWVKTFLKHPVPFEPGTHFRYNTLGTYMTAAIVEKTVGEPIVDYLQPRLFDPLQIERPYWEVSPQGICKGGTGLFLRTEDMAKFGELYLQKGEWNGKQILPAEWVAEATSKHVSNGDNPESDWNQGYGFQFWRCRHNIYRGDGAHCQFIVVIPDKDAVIVSTADCGDYQGVLNHYWKALLPAFQDAPLPENPEALARLQAAEKGLVAKEGITGSIVREKCPLKSEILGREMNYSIYLPAGYWTTGCDYPVLYLLHGLGGDSESWLRPNEGNLKAIADEWFRGRQSDKMIIVLPDAQNRWYMNSADGKERFEDYFFNELIPKIERSYRCKTGRDDRAIAGLSMGGHGALLYALHHPELFRSCVALSAAVRTDEELRAMPLDQFNRRYHEALGTVGENDERLSEFFNRNRVLPLLAKLPKEPPFDVRILLDCGEGDALLSGNRAVDGELTRLGVPHELIVRPGVHRWEYWRESLPGMLQFITE